MKALIRVLDTFSDAVYKVQKCILFLAVGAMVLINGAQIAGRYVFHYSLPWSEQVSIVLFTLLIMLGGNIAIKENSEIKITLFQFKNRKIEAGLGLIADIGSLVALVLLIVSNVMLIEQASRLTKIVSSIRLDYKYIYMVVLAGFALITFEKLLAMCKRIASLSVINAGSEKEGES